CFFFSSRRRHTRFSRDWSSDVCSSDLIDHVAFRNMDERLEFYLKRHARVTGKKTIELSHQQIAEDLNTSREVISRLLKKMEQGRSEERRVGKECRGRCET